jgi:hypothetical protein
LNSQNSSLPLPGQKDYEIAYTLAFKLAGEKLSGPEIVEEQCRMSGSFCQTTGALHTVLLHYLNRSYRVSWPDIDIVLADSDEQVELRDKVLILHYLTGARGTPLSHQLISYQELHEGAAYYPSFIKRAVKPLIDCFGQNPERLLEAASEIGAQKVDLGDVAVRVMAFALVPVTLILRRGDEEFPPDASILFDSTILDYLMAEDINVLCQTLVWRLVRSRQAGPK